MLQSISREEGPLRTEDESREMPSQRPLLTFRSYLQSGDSDTASVLSGVSRTSSRLQREFIMIGFVGYPNVGKSSTINALVGQKKVGVTSTPGKTKHFQTLIVSDSVMLCDCPGLVFPSVVSSRAEMVRLPFVFLRTHRHSKF